MHLNYFNFREFGDEILITNDLGRYQFLSRQEFMKLVRKEIDTGSDLYSRLKRNYFIYDVSDLEFSEEVKNLFRRSREYLLKSTSLHIFVVDTACNLNCIYCQANNGVHKPKSYMSQETAVKAVDLALQSPCTELNFEFQGGEPLLNFPVIKKIISYAEENKKDHVISYNLVSNLTLLSEEMVNFLTEHNVNISTSIDGPGHVHDLNRPLGGRLGSHEAAVKRLKELQERKIPIGAIQTTTRHSLDYPGQIVDHYLELGFNSLFLRPLTPLGKASFYWESVGYSATEFIRFYREAFERIIELNKKGNFLKEEHASIFLRKMDGQPVNYMELRSPCGAMQGQVAYYPDGNVFTCDEGRMLYEMGDDAFLLGNVFQSSFADLAAHSVSRATSAASTLESIPGCCDCAYQPYCGVCPVITWANNNDILEKRPNSYRCQIYQGMLDILFGYLKRDDPQINEIFESWRN